MSFDRDQIDLAVTELSSAVLRLRRAGLSESQSNKLISRLLELDELPVSCDEKMWDDAEPKGDSSADAVKESEDSGPETKRDPVPWHQQVHVDKDDDEKAPESVKEGEDCDESMAETEEVTEGCDRFMGDILIAEGRRVNARSRVLPDSPGMLHAKRYGEKAHNRIVIKK